MMRYVKLLAAALIGAAFLSGCAAIPGVNAAANKAVDAVDKYCATFTTAERQAMRERVNDRLAAEGHSIQIQCAVDN